MEKIGNTPFSNKRSILFLYCFIVLLFFSGCQNNNLHFKGGSDGAVEVPRVYEKAKKFEHSDIEEHSIYLTMRDGVKIAVDYYLPKGLPKGTKIPAIVHQTRYWRSIGIRNFASFFLDQFYLQSELGLTKEKFIKHGYAWIDVDVRGSGASFGFRKSEWSIEEVRDGKEIVNWVVSQPWCNGNIGAFGVSYSGTSAEFLLTNRHPAIKAAVPMYTMFDVFADVAFPGGTQLSGFTKGWGYVNSLLDRNMLPNKIGWKGKITLTGVKPVKGQEALLFKALLDHDKNWEVHEEASKIDFRNDKNSYGLTVDDFSIHHYYDLINHSNVPVYAYSGWYDGAYARAAIKKYLNLKHPGKKLIIGPWNHGGEQNASPFATGKIHGDHYDSGFDHFAEVLKFFDVYLKNETNGLDKEKPIHYYTIGEEKWKATDVWPPKSKNTDLFLGTDNRLSKKCNQNLEAMDIYTIDTTAGTGIFSRWSSLLGGGVIKYPDRREEDQKLLCYDSGFLKEPLEITGHPIIKLYIAANAEDLDIHVYLEEVDKYGKIILVTEGNLRAINRKIIEQALYIDIVPYRSFRREDAVPLVPEEITEITFDLLPISYQFQKGSKIRVAISGGDKDIFKRIPNSASKIKVYRSAQYASKIELPVIEANSPQIVFQD